jgi:hypothetical protein
MTPASVLDGSTTPAAAARIDPNAQLNWLARYVPVLPHLDDDARRSLLEVGCGARGIGCVLPTPFVGVEIAFTAPPAAPMLPLEYEGDRLPFRDAAFHTAVSMDTLEHVPPAGRPGFLRELARVAAARVVVGFPADAVAAALDRSMQTLLPRLGAGTPDWLHEHDAYGMPESRLVEEVLNGLAGWRWRAVATTGTFPALLLTLADSLPETRAWARTALADHGDALAGWIAAGCFGPSFRKVYVLERDGAPAPAIAAVDPPRVWSALACPVCAAVIRPRDPVVACDGCRARWAPDARGVLRLTRAARLREPSAHAATFVLRPRWLHDTAWVAAVHNYLQAFPPDDPCRLWLEIDPNELAGSDALALLRPILAPLGAASFPALALSDDPEEPPPAGALVRLPEDGGALTDWTPERFRAAVRELS